MTDEDNKTDTKQTSISFDQRVTEIIQSYLKTTGFTDRKLTDTPTDANQVVPRKFVTLNGVKANRPTGSITGQYYFDITIGRPVYWNGSTFVDGAGSVS